MGPEIVRHSFFGTQMKTPGKVELADQQLRRCTTRFHNFEATP